MAKSQPALPVFQQLFIISDLHLGGTVASSQFQDSDAFKQWLNNCVFPPARDGHSVGLVINGDFFDFLVTDEKTYFDPARATRMVTHLAEVEFRQVFEGLKTFLRMNDTRIVITLGNHDVELRATQVQDAVRKALGPIGVDSQRVVFALSKDGYLCKVGKDLVWCIHGNDVDDWNVIDHSDIDERIREFEQHGICDTSPPNAGTQLVIDVLNQKRKRLPVLEYLKPEDTGLLFLAAVVDPSTKELAGPLLSAWLRQDILVGMKAWFGLLSTEVNEEHAGLIQSERQELVKRLLSEPLLTVSGASIVDNLLRTAHDDVLAEWRDRERARGMPGVLQTSRRRSADSARMTARGHADSTPRAPCGRGCGARIKTRSCDSICWNGDSTPVTPRKIPMARLTNAIAQRWTCEAPNMW